MKRYDNDDIMPYTGTSTLLNMRQEDAGENQILTSVSLALSKENSQRSRWKIMKMRRMKDNISISRSLLENEQC